MAETQLNGKAETNGKAAAGPPLPQWLEAKLFENLLRKDVAGYKKINEFKAYPALAAGENYATIMLRIDITVELEAGKTKLLSYMMKIAHDNDMFNGMLEHHNIFDVESNMYVERVPEFEKMFEEAGVEVKFGAQSYRLDIDKNYILLEDLRPRGFKNANRLEGLDMEHTKCVLKKLAQFHAASATRFETKGKYSDIYTIGFFKESSRVLMEQMNESLSRSFMKCIDSYQGHEVYLESVQKMNPKLTEAFFKMGKVDPNEFNVLNHGDCWSNNIMFQYDAFGKIKETYFVDLQMSKYGSPAQDLLYFLLSSTRLELKLKQFEFFVKFYHDNLIESLVLLKYPKKLPTLKDIHIQLYKYGMWGYSTVTGVMAAVLLDPNDNASLDNFLGDTEAGDAFKMLMFSNDRYRKHVEAILPWLLNRGALEC